MASSGLVDHLTTENDLGVNPAIINSTGIETELPPMAPYYPTGRLSPPEESATRQGQQGIIADDEDNANKWGKPTFPISYPLTGTNLG